VRPAAIKDADHRSDGLRNAHTGRREMIDSGVHMVER
jgi:hypothetical protein